jgi:hypothetical protein
MLGLPPKVEHILFARADIQWNQRIVVEWMKGKGFEVKEVTNYTVSAKLNFRYSFLSFFAMGKPKMEWHVLFTEEGRVTIRSSYDYDSLFGTAFNDFGRQRRYISELEQIFKTT